MSVQNKNCEDINDCIAQLSKLMESQRQVRSELESLKFEFSELKEKIAYVADTIKDQLNNNLITKS